MSYRISVDTGGTFTDVVISDANDRMVIGKALTTPDRIFLGMKAAIKAAAKQLELNFEQLMARTNVLIYGTTRATNAIVTKTTAKTAFVTTAGFPDILLLKEGGKFNPHDFTLDFPDPYILRRNTFQLQERIGSDGEVVEQLDETQAKELIAEIGGRKFEAVAVCLLWSIANPSHEKRFAELLSEQLPGIPYTLSHELAPVIREYRRASATAIDASLKPLMQGHLNEMRADLHNAGFNGDLLISTTEGGCNHIDVLAAKPIYTVGSGPAMAPVAARTFSDIEGQGSDVIVCDTGGTTFDVGLVRDGRLTFTRDTWLGDMYTGNLLGISAVDVRSIGAGGGSIAWIDEGGLMRVGPQSAGSKPGPACYGLGGTEPTVSDAAVVLGYFNPENFLGGRMRLDATAARNAVAKIAVKIGLTTEQAAFQILALASDLMTRAIADMTVNEGFNPRESTIVAGGGAAGVNIMAIARELGCDKAILPKVASALSASGMQFADIVAEEAQSYVVFSNDFERKAVNVVLEELEGKLEAFRREIVGSVQDYDIELIAEARYVGQVWELDTRLPTRRFETDADLQAFIEVFHQTHERVFAVRDIGSSVQIVNWKARLVAHLPSKPRPGEQAAIRRKGTSGLYRDCFFGASKPVKTEIYQAEEITPGLLINGPAIIEEPTTTLVVYPGMAAEVSRYGNYILHLTQEVK
ncbi:hydantoinase/oxoprolinase family protein [uncultured Nitratireductor sp.]|uniref:hydantoinase/oxoprolinase family protein n=1 Tax=uncultured Nitratireductor sp. TaxID=520953 RepID=UPI002619A0F8|nr:hydantoinase/oxoprolinase family protein [uncultured Nitratireductor sp.]